MPEELNLLPCPACGKTGKLFYGIDWYAIACSGFRCRLQGPVAEEKDDAAIAWNSLPRVLTWTKEPPKVIGWYFWRSETVQGVGYETTIYIADVPEFLEHFKACTHENVMFAGPIPTPKEPEA